MKPEEIKEMIKNGSFGIVFPKAKEDEKNAMELSEMIENAVAVASFVDNKDENKVSYGVITRLTLLEDNGEIETQEKK